MEILGNPEQWQEVEEDNLIIKLYFSLLVCWLSVYQCACTLYPILKCMHYYLLLSRIMRNNNVPTLSLYKQYSEYKFYSRRPNDDFTAFINQYEVLWNAVKENIWSKYTLPQIQVLDLLSVCNLAHDDVDSILDSLQELEEVDDVYRKVKQSIKDIAAALEDLTEHKVENDFDSLIAQDNVDQENTPAIVTKNDDNILQIEYKDGIAVGSNESFEGSFTEDVVCDDVETKDQNFTVIKFKKEEKRGERGTKLGGNYNCDGCGKGFTTTTTLNCHKKSKRCGNQDNMSFFCETCNITHDSYKSYINHRSLMHAAMKMNKDEVIKIDSAHIKCVPCDKIVSIFHWYRHRLGHGNKKAQCSTCGKMIKLSQMSKHRSYHRKKELGNILRCDQCNYTTLHPLCLKQHYKVNHAPKDFSCEICGSAFGTQARLNDHVRNRHGGMKFCPHCSFSSDNLGTYESHISKLHTKVANNVCPFCSFETEDKSLLQDHVRQAHPYEEDHPRITKSTKDYSCDLCDFKGNTKQGLRAHKQVKHLGVRYKCDQCEWSTTSKGGVKAHVMRVHQKIKFPCKFCDFQGADRNVTRSHMFKKHPEFKIYSCHLCKYRTEKKELLQRHLTGKYGAHGKNPTL